MWRLGRLVCAVGAIVAEVYCCAIVSLVCIVKKVNEFPFSPTHPTLATSLPTSAPILLLLGLLSASAAVRVRLWEENLSVFLFSVLPLAVFPFSVFSFPLDRLLPPFELVVIGKVDGGEMCLLRSCFFVIARSEATWQSPFSVLRSPFSEGGQGATN